MTSPQARIWRVHLPYTLPPLTANQRLHWAKRARITRQIRKETALLCKTAKLPALERAKARIVYVPRDRRRRDPSNLMPTQKAAIDGLVTAGIIRDDNPRYLDELMPSVATPRRTSSHPLGWRIYLEITQCP